ncbi:HAD-superfamily hydrolase [Chytriomyces cf. hyalinus JEL632]|nr:HAD-superfamily hydrolase [Chytriomyces cf. hyalinus JEL632]
MPIKNIVFDLGGVILNLDYGLTTAAFAERFGIADFNSTFSQYKQTNFMDEFETGVKNSLADLSAYLRASFPEELVDASDESIAECWNAMLLDIPQSRINTLRTLRGMGYRVYLLSNINAVHEVGVDRIIERDVDGGLEAWRASFDALFYSHWIGHRKPHVETFLHVVQSIGGLPEETLFLDDSVQHVEGARRAGLHAALVSKPVNAETVDLYAVTMEALGSLHG